MRKQTTYRLPIGAEAFWRRLYLDPVYLTELHLQGMQCEAFSIRNMHGTVEDGFQLSLFSKPKLSIPKPLQKVLGRSISYVENGTFSSDTGRYSFSMTPSTLSNKIFIAGECWIERVDDDCIERHIDLEFSAKIFGVGSVLERFIAKSNLENQEKTVRFTQQWLTK